MKPAFYTIFALVCFAFNSILCRLALKTEEIDAPSFTVIRLVSGAITLFVIFSFFGKKEAINKQGNWLSAFWLFLYAICFSFAYLRLTTATGALVLFGSVQLTMIIFALVKGERPRVLEWLGLTFRVWRIGLSCSARSRIAADSERVFNDFGGNCVGILYFARKGKHKSACRNYGKFLAFRADGFADLFTFHRADKIIVKRNNSRGFVGRDCFGNRLCGLVCRAQISHGNPRRGLTTFRSRYCGNRRCNFSYRNHFNSIDFSKQFDSGRHWFGDFRTKYEI